MIADIRPANEGNVPAPSQPNFVIGIAAEKRRLNRVERLVEEIGDDAESMAFVVMALDPVTDARRILGELNKVVDIDIVMVDDRASVECGTLYIVPDGREVVVRKGTIEVRTDHVLESGRARQAFFRNLGSAYGPNSVAVQFGQREAAPERALRSIRDRGGLVFAERRPTGSSRRRHSSTPYADGFVEADRLGTAVRTVLREISKTNVPAGGKELRQKFDSMVDSLEHHNTRSVSFYRVEQLVRAARKRMALRELDDLDTYLTALGDDAEEADRFVDEVLIGVTRFFRNEKLWRELSRQLTEIVRDRGDSPFRAWVAGCSTGEEAYSLAIVLMEVYEAAGLQPNFTVFATDVLDESLEAARRGRFPGYIEEEIAAPRLERWFRPVNTEYVAAVALNDRVVTCHHDVVDDAPLTDCDLVSCQNLLTVLHDDARERASENLAWAVCEGGLLVLDHGSIPDEGFVSLSDGVARRNGRVLQTDVLDEHDPAARFAASAAATAGDLQSLMTHLIEAANSLDGEPSREELFVAIDGIVHAAERAREASRRLAEKSFAFARDPENWDTPRASLTTDSGDAPSDDEPD